MQLRLLLWWITYIFCGILLQRIIPGIDLLVPGFLLALQRGSKKEIFWLFILFTLIQEGTGSLKFGTSPLWYLGIIFVFHISARMFVADNLLFVSVLSASLGTLHAFLLWFMCLVQDTPINYFDLMAEAIMQTLAIPIVWGIAYILRPKAFRHVH